MQLNYFISNHLFFKYYLGVTLTHPEDYYPSLVNPAVSDVVTYGHC